jgi:hypothetical protein
MEHVETVQHTKITRHLHQMVPVKYLFFCAVLCSSLYSCGQSKKVIAAVTPVKKAIAIYAVHLPGNIAMDPNGNSISRQDTLNVIYLETGAGRIQWKEAWKDNKNYSVIATAVAEPLIDAGIDKKTNKKIFLQATGGNTLWKLLLVPEEKFHSAPSKYLSGEIILAGVYHGKKILQKIDAPREINSTPSF